MRRGCLLLSAFSVLAGCNASPPQDCAVANAPKRAIECLEQNATKNEREQLLTCFPFAKPEMMEGLWIIDLERSSFYENAKVYSPTLERANDVWLYVDDELRRKVERQFGPSQRLMVAFIGRRAKCDGPWGHMGMSPKAVVVERLVSISG